jgi:hypothetical protein
MKTCITDFKTCITDFFAFPIALFTGLGDIKLSKYEKKVLSRKLADYIWQSGFSQSFLAWRRRLLYCASAFLAVSTAMQLTDLAINGVFTQEDESLYTALGLTAMVSMMIAPFILFAVSIAAAWFWSEYKKSRTLLISGWIFASSLVLFFHLIPLKYMFVDPNSVTNALLGVAMAIAILPTYLALIGGLTLGSKRVYYFAPSPLTGAMVVLSHAFAIIIPFAALTLIVQLLGDGLLLFGLYLLLLGPIVVVMTSSRFTAITAFSSSETILVSQRILLGAGLCRIAALIVIMVWLILVIKNGVDVFADGTLENISIEGLVSTYDVVEIIFQFLGSMMFQAVLWTDIVIHISRNDDLKMQKLQSDLL